MSSNARNFEKLFKLLNFLVCVSYVEMGRQGGSRSQIRIKWTEEMNEALLQCKKKAIQLTKSAMKTVERSGICS